MKRTSTLKKDAFFQLRSEAKISKVTIAAIITLFFATFSLFSITVSPIPFERSNILNIWIYENCEERIKIDAITDLENNRIQFNFTNAKHDNDRKDIDQDCGEVSVGSDRDFVISSFAMKSLNMSRASRLAEKPVFRDTSSKSNELFAQPSYTIEFPLQDSDRKFDRLSIVAEFNSLTQSRALGEELLNLRVWYPDRRPISNAVQLHVLRGSIDRRLMNAIPAPIEISEMISFPIKQHTDSREIATGRRTHDLRLPFYRVSASFENVKLTAIREVLTIFLSIIIGAAASAIFEIKLAKANRIDIDFTKTRRTRVPRSPDSISNDQRKN